MSKSPATTIFPSLWIANVASDVLIHPAKVPTTNPVSLDPSVFKRTILLTGLHLYVVKEPIITIFPSLWTSTDLTSSSKPFPITKDVSTVPSVFKRTILFAENQLIVVEKAPATTIFPLDWSAILLIVVPCRYVHPVKVASMVPSANIRTKLGYATHL